MAPVGGSSSGDGGASNQASTAAAGGAGGFYRPPVAPGARNVFELMRQGQSRRYRPYMREPSEATGPIAIGFPSKSLAWNHAVLGLEKFGISWETQKMANEQGKRAVTALADAVYLLDFAHKSISDRFPSFARTLHALGFAYFPDDHPDVSAVLAAVRPSILT